jgi:hypothetical protein
MAYTKTTWVEGTTPIDAVKLNKIETGIETLDTGKVDKVTGKKLTPEEFTLAEKTKLGTVLEGANVNLVTKVAGRIGDVVLAKSDVGLSEVPNYGVATQLEAETGTSDLKYMTPLKVKQSIQLNSPAPVIATNGEATTGTDNTKMMTPLRVKESVVANAPVPVDLLTTLDTTWSGTSAPFTKAQTVTGLLATDTPLVDIVMSGTYATDEARGSAWGNVYRVTTALNTLTLYAKEKPTVSLPIIIKVVK